MVYSFSGLRVELSFPLSKKEYAKYVSNVLGNSIIEPNLDVDVKQDERNIAS